MGPEPTKFALNFPMFLLFPKFHFLARFAMPWSFLCVCRQQAKVLRTNVNTCTIGGSELSFLSVNPYNWPNQLSLFPPLILNALLLLLLIFVGVLESSPCAVHWADTESLYQDHWHDTLCPASFYYSRLLSSVTRASNHLLMMDTKDFILQSLLQRPVCEFTTKGDM